MENNNRQGCRLKNILVVCEDDDNYQIWPRYKYKKYIRGCVKIGGGSAYRIVTHFNGNESLLTDQPESIEPCATSSENKNTNMNKSFSKFIGDNAVAEINGFALPGSEYAIRVIGSITDGDYLTDYIVQARPLGRDGETLHFRVSVFTDTIEPHNIQPLIKQ